MKTKNFKHVGTWWNDRNVELVEIDDKVYALYGWNGEEWTSCWECLGDDYMEAGENVVIRPIYEETNKDEWEIVGFELAGV